MKVNFVRKIGLLQRRRGYLHETRYEIFRFAIKKILFTLLFIESGMKYNFVSGVGRTARKVFKYGAFSGSYFPVLSANTGNTDQKKLSIWTLFKQCKSESAH